MKKYCFVLSFLMCVFISSCENENICLTSKSKVEELKKISEYHSSGLDAIYTQLAGSSTRSISSNVTRKDIIRLASDYIYSQSKLENFKTRSLSPSEQISDTIVRQLSPKADSLFNEYFTNLVKSSSKESMLSYVESLLREETFMSLDSDEQNFLTFMMYIGIDSAEYWSNPYNLDKWMSLKTNSPITTTRSVAGPAGRYWLTRKQINNPAFQKILGADCRGCGYSLLCGFSPWGWAAGGIAGSVDAALF